MTASRIPPHRSPRSRSRATRVAVIGAAAAAALAASTGTAQAAGTGAAAAAKPGPWAGLTAAAIGDSISAGWGSAGAPFPDVSASWSTGTQDGLGSHLQRLQQLAPAGRWNAVDLAQPGATAADLLQQARRVPADAAYVTVSTGFSNVCAGSVTRVGQLLAPDAFQLQVRGALASLADRAPSAKLLVLSLPDVSRLWSRFHGDPTMRAAWRRPGTCPLVLGPRATAATRDTVRLLSIQYNVVLRQACAALERCRFDGGAAFALQPRRGDLSTYDGLHLSPRGQARLSAVTWATGWFADRAAAKQLRARSTDR